MTQPAASSDADPGAFPKALHRGRSLPGLAVNLLVRDPRPSADFDREVLGDADQLERAAVEAGGTVLQPAQDKPHGWRERIVAVPERVHLGGRLAIGVSVP